MRLGFLAFQRFYVRSMGHKSPPSYENFAKSKLYLSFVRFGRHVADLNAINPLGFVDFLLRIETPIDRWTNQNLYATYIRELSKNELPIDALERNFLLMQQWAMNTGHEWHDFFRKVEVPQAVLWLTNGRISPWILFTASSAHLLLSRFSAEQMDILNKTIDVDFWQLKLARHQNEVDMIRETLAENGI